jgi:hypothetical protein
VSSRRATTTVCVGVLLLTWGTYWAAFFPGVVSHDVLVQWSEIQSGRYSDLHPAFRTFVLWLLTRVYPSLGTVSAVHVIVGAVLAAFVLGAAHGLGAPRWIVALAIVWLTVSPIFAMNVIAVGRDSAFALTLLWTTALLVRRRSRGPS